MAIDSHRINEYVAGGHAHRAETSSYPKSGAKLPMPTTMPKALIESASAKSPIVTLKGAYMAMKQKAGDTCRPKGTALSSQASENRCLKAVRTARQITPRTKVALPPLSTVFGGGGETGTVTDTIRSPKIKSRTTSSLSKITAESGKNHSHAKTKPPSKDRERGLVQGKLVASATPTDSGLGQTCQQLRELQRRKVAALKARIAIDNQLTALVAIELGYSAGLDEKDRKALWTEARKTIGNIADGKAEGDASKRVGSVVKATLMSRDGFESYLGGIEKAMTKLAKELPVLKWCESVRGFGLLSLAAIVGECGNIGDFRGPASLWKRLGLAPITSRGKTQMPSTWRSGGGLSAEEWTEAGYSPRRRSIMYVIGECLVKQNDGEFRARYDESKASAHKRHEDWTDGHCHNHAMLLAVKRLVKRLWQKWRGQEGDILPSHVGQPSRNVVAAKGKAKKVDSKRVQLPSRTQRVAKEASPLIRPLPLKAARNHSIQRRLDSAAKHK